MANMESRPNPITGAGVSMANYNYQALQLVVANNRSAFYGEELPSRTVARPNAVLSQILICASSSTRILTTVGSLDGFQGNRVPTTTSVNELTDNIN